jgi:hypothetical protein
VIKLKKTLVQGQPVIALKQELEPVCAVTMAPTSSAILKTSVTGSLLLDQTAESQQEAPLAHCVHNVVCDLDRKPATDMQHNFIENVKFETETSNLDPNTLTLPNDNSSEIQTEGENVVVQHYLLTSIITNTPTGQQTSQLITTPILLPSGAEVISDGVATVPIQVIGDSVVSNNGNDSSIETNSRNNDNSIYEQNQTIEMADNEDSRKEFHFDEHNIATEVPDDEPGAARCIPVFHSSLARDKINITFARRSSDDEMTENMSHNMDIVEVFESMVAEANGNVMSDTSHPDPHCQDRCADYTELVDTDTEYVLINPVADDFSFEDDLESPIQGVDNNSVSRNPDVIDLSVAASQELSDALSSL